MKSIGKDTFILLCVAKCRHLSLKNKEDKKGRWDKQLYATDKRQGNTLWCTSLAFYYTLNPFFIHELMSYTHVWTKLVSRICSSQVCHNTYFYWLTSAYTNSASHQLEFFHSSDNYTWSDAVETDGKVKNNRVMLQLGKPRLYKVPYMVQKKPSHQTECR